MTDYTYAQLETLWINAGGPKSLAPIAAAIAEAESGGNSDALNPNDNGGTQSSFGLWQISNGTHTPPSPTWSNPATNAQLAVAKYKGAGNSFSPWGTYDSGAYKAYINNGTSPDPNVPGSPTAVTTAAQASQSSDCAWQVNLGIPLIGGSICIFTKSELRGIAGVALMGFGGFLGLAGLAVLIAAAGMKAAPPLGKAAEAAGGALLLVPGAEGIGAGMIAAGKTAKSPAAAGRRRQARRAGEENAQRRRLGEPRENPDLEVRGGAVRQDRRQQAAQRSRERRRTASDEPPF